MSINVVLFEGISAYSLQSGYTSHSAYADTAGTASVVLGSISTASLALAGSGSFIGEFGGDSISGFTGSFTGSFIGDGAEISNIVSSSYALTASFALNGGGGGGGSGVFGGNFSGSFSGSVSASGLLINGVSGISTSLTLTPDFTGSFLTTSSLTSFYNALNIRGQVSASFPTNFESDMFLYNGWADTAINQFLYSEVKNNQTVNNLYGIALSSMIDSSSRVVNSYGVYISPPLSASVISGDNYAIFVQDYQQSYLSNVTSSYALVQHDLTVLGDFVADTMLIISPHTSHFQNNSDSLPNQTKIFRSEITEGHPALFVVADSGSYAITIPTNLFGVTLGSIGILGASGNGGNSGRVQLGIFGYAEQAVVDVNPNNLVLGGYFLAQLTGSTDTNIWGGSMYGVRALANISASVSASGPVYGGYFEASGSANNGVVSSSQQVAYGVYAKAVHGDRNWAGWFDGTTFTRGIIGTADETSVWTVNGRAYDNLFFTGDGNGGRAGVVGVGGVWSSSSIPNIGTFGSVGIVGAANGMSGTRPIIGGYFYATQNVANGPGQNTLIGAYGLAQPQVSASGFANWAYGVSGLADVTLITGGVGTGSLISVVGTRGQAKGVSGSAAYGVYGTANTSVVGGATYGGYFEATGTGPLFGLAVGSGSLVVSESARIYGAVTASAFSGNGAAIIGIISASYATNAGSANTSTSASFAQISLTANSATIATTATSASYATTASYASVAQTLLGSIVSSSYAVTASNAAYAQQALSASWAPGIPTTSASYADVAKTVSPAQYVQLTGDTMTGNLTVTGSVAITGDVTSSGNAWVYGQTLIIGNVNQTIGSIVADSGVFKFSMPIRFTGGGVKQDDPTLGFTFSDYYGGLSLFVSGNTVGVGTNTPNPGSNRGLDISGSLNVQAGATIAGTLSATGSLLGSASYALSALSASWAPGSGASVSSSYALTASFASNALTANSATTATSASYASVATTISPAKYVQLTGDTMTGGLTISGTLLVSGAINTSPYPITASAFTGDGSKITGVISASFAQTTLTANSATSASYASLASSGTGSFTGSFTGTHKGDGSQLTGIVSSSFAQNALTANSATTATSASFASNALTANSATTATSASYASVATTISPAKYVQLTGDSMTGGLTISGTLLVSGAINTSPYPITGSAFKGVGTQITGVVSASFASTALSASYAPGSPSVSSSYALTASYASVAQTLLGSITSASYALTASYAAVSSYSTDGRHLRLSYTVSSSALAPTYLQTGSVALGQAFVLFIASSSTDTRLRLYCNAERLNYDLARPLTQDPSGGVCLFEAIFTGSNKVIYLAPTVYGYNGEAVVTNNIPFIIENLSAVTASLSVVLSYSSV